MGSSETAGFYKAVSQRDEFLSVDAAAGGGAAVTSSTSGFRTAAITVARAAFLVLAIGLAIVASVEFTRTAPLAGWGARPTQGSALRSLTSARALTHPFRGHVTHDNSSLELCNSSMPLPDVKQ